MPDAEGAWVSLGLETSGLASFLGVAGVGAGAAEGMGPPVTGSGSLRVEISSSGSAITAMVLPTRIPFSPF